jgi:transcription elongation factor Elf1
MPPVAYYAYFKCPECNRKGVHFLVPDRTNFATDCYQCKYCKHTVTRTDTEGIAKLVAANDRPAKLWF